MLKKKFWRDSLSQPALMLAFEYLIVVIVVLAIGQDNVFFSSIAGLALLYLFRALNVTVKAAVSTVTYYLSKQRLVGAIVNKFYHHKLPVKNNLAFLGGSEYIQEIANSEDTSEDLRRFLDRTLGELDGSRLAGALPFLRMNAILDAAVERYVSENNARSRMFEAA